MWAGLRLAASRTMNSIMRPVPRSLFMANLHQEGERKELCNTMAHCPVPLPSTADINMIPYWVLILRVCMHVCACVHVCAPVLCVCTMYVLVHMGSLDSNLYMS